MSQRINIRLDLALSPNSRACRQLLYPCTQAANKSPLIPPSSNPSQNIIVLESHLRAVCDSYGLHLPLHAPVRGIAKIHMGAVSGVGPIEIFVGITYSLFMQPTYNPRVKICCILNHVEARLAIEAGASAIGLVGKMPSGPGVIDDERAAMIARTTPPPIATFLLTSAQSVTDIVAHYHRVHSTVLQIVDELREGTYEELRMALPGVKLVQVVHVTGPESIDRALMINSRVDALLLDSGRPDLAVKELGGTGRRHDWSISRRIRESLSIPVFLAGGLHPDNVRQAIEEVRPFGVDVCSGVRTGGMLDAVKLRNFMASVQTFQQGGA